jgi:hypothetical protein
MAGVKVKKNWFKEMVGKLKKKPHPLFRSGYLNDAVEMPMQSSTVISWTDATSTMSPTVNYVSGGNGTEVKSTDNRIVKKPIEIWQELCLETPKIDLANIDIQIKTVERRVKILEEEIGITTSDEKIALKYLYARRKLKKLKKNEFMWQTTTNELIGKLESKYKIRKVGFGSYYKCVPNEALEQLEKYSNAWKKISDSVPEINLIIDDGGVETKKDPILIASSPFGNWWFILGAWDKEIEYVDDIVYKGK